MMRGIVRTFAMGVGLIAGAALVSAPAAAKHYRFDIAPGYHTNGPASAS